MKKYIGFLIVLSVLVFGIKVQAAATANYNQVVPQAPVFVATPATFAGGAGFAVLNGTYSANSSPISKVWFWYGTDSSLPQSSSSFYDYGLKEPLTGTGPIGQSIGGFTPGQTYYYKICGLNTVDSSCSNVVSFIEPTNGIVSCPPSIKVLSPNGGEIYQAGNQITVKWTSCNVPASDKLDITLKNMDQPMEQDLTNPGTGTSNDGSETFTLNLPQTMQLGTHFKVLVNDSYLTISSGQVGDWSDNLFTINGAGVISDTTSVATTTPVSTLSKTEVTSPTIVSFNRVLNVGSKGADVSALQKILKQKGFLSANPTGYYGTLTRDAVKKYQKNANFINTNGKVDANTIEMIKGEQVIPSKAISQDILPVVVPTPTPTPTPLPAISSIKVVSPNGGESWQLGSNQTINWKDNYSPINCSNDLTNVDNCATVAPAPMSYDINLVSYFPPCTGGMCSLRPQLAPFSIAKNVVGYSYPWNVGKILDENRSVSDSSYQIQICRTGTDVCDFTDSYFRISSSDVISPSITVLSPNGGENFTKGTSSSTGDMLNHKVQFSSKKIGNITNYITQSNDINNWKNSKYYWVGGGQGFNPNVSNTDGGSFQINDTFIDPGTYYFLSTWQSQDGTEFAYDFSDATFGINSTTNITTNDTTPRIMYWYGKVNQHIDAQGNWQTDSDGVSGANLDKLTYCKKFFPNTTSVEDYKVETIGTWKDAGNTQDVNRLSAYTTPKMSTKCVQNMIISNTTQ